MISSASQESLLLGRAGFHDAEQEKREGDSFGEKKRKNTISSFPPSLFWATATRKNAPGGSLIYLQWYRLTIRLRKKRFWII